MGLKKEQEKQYAQLLFVYENLSQKEIAERAKVNEKTVCKWIEQGQWKKLKRSLLTTKQTQISRLYDQLEFINDQIAARDYKVAVNKEPGIIKQITSSIEKLETETNIAQTVEVGRGVIEYIRLHNLDDAQKLTEWFDLFIHAKLK